MLDFIYTGTIHPNVMESFAQGILAISDKYAVMPLKEFCEHYLAAQINKKNISSMAVIADTYFANFLKKACTRFIACNHKTIIRSPEWKELKCTQSALANELLESVLDEQSTNSGEEQSEAAISMISHADMSSYSSSTEYISGHGYVHNNLRGPSALSASGPSSSSTNPRHVYYSGNSLQAHGHQSSSGQGSSSAHRASDSLASNRVAAPPSVDDESGTPRKRLRRTTPRNT